MRAQYEEVLVQTPHCMASMQVPSDLNVLRRPVLDDVPRATKTHGVGTSKFHIEVYRRTRFAVPYEMAQTWLTWPGTKVWYKHYDEVVLPENDECWLIVPIFVREP